ncbi:copper transport protein ATX1-like [Senna tora]|uniref:Copper transport protein ATX1-like n=1 Tax=Senna tora TaxID=362788 RepID=A0A834WIF5_9FABA|nr:copper transport protein ATX1-like [Senna tora]
MSQVLYFHLSPDYFFDFDASACFGTVVLKVGMSCEGCAGAVRRVLGKMEGVESYDIDMKEQKVTVKGNVQPEAVLQTVSKTGKKTALWEAEAPAPAEAEKKTTETETASAPAEPEKKTSETETASALA